MSKPENFLALHVASGPCGAFVLDGALPGWQKPDGDSAEWPEADQGLDALLGLLMDDPQWWVDGIPDERLGDGLQCVLVRWWEPPGADHEITLDLDFEVIGVRPTAHCGSWADHAASDVDAAQSLTPA